MQTYQTTLGGLPATGTDYGTWNAETPADAVLLAMRDADATREYATPELLSTSASFGLGAAREGYDGAGNGAQDRSAWLYVTDAHGVLVGIYTVAALDPRAETEYAE